jgi:hypothetical protein
MFQRSILLATICIMLCACAEKKPEPKPDIQGGTYFSIRQFSLDQWNTHHGQPYSIEKTAYMNGKTDSVLLNAYTLDWGAVFKVFFATDISDPKYLDHYNFSMFEDNATTTRNFYYEAKDDDLFTRKFQVSADAFTDKVRSIYVETEKKTRWSTVTQKLLYIPVKVISIQEFEWTGGNEPKELRIEYRFL